MGSSCGWVSHQGALPGESCAALPLRGLRAHQRGSFQVCLPAPRGALQPSHLCCQPPCGGLMSTLWFSLSDILWGYFSSLPPYFLFSLWQLLLLNNFRVTRGWLRPQCLAAPRRGFPGSRGILTRELILAWARFAEAAGLRRAAFCPGRGHPRAVPAPAPALFCSLLPVPVPSLLPQGPPTPCDQDYIKSRACYCAASQLFYRS